MIKYEIQILKDGVCLPVIIYLREIDISLFDQVFGATLVFSKNRSVSNVNSLSRKKNDKLLLKYIKDVIREIRNESGCKNLLLFEFYCYKSSKKSFRFSSHEDYDDSKNPGYLTMCLISDKGKVKLDHSLIDYPNSISDHFDAGKKKVHGFKVGFSSKLLDSLSKPRAKSKFNDVVTIAVTSGSSVMRHLYKEY